jgi:hypothetical protein
MRTAERSIEEARAINHPNSLCSALGRAPRLIAMLIGDMAAAEGHTRMLTPGFTGLGNRPDVGTSDFSPWFGLTMRAVIGGASRKLDRRYFCTALRASCTLFAVGNEESLPVDRPRKGAEGRLAPGTGPAKLPLQEAPITRGQPTLIAKRQGCASGPHESGCPSG